MFNIETNVCHASCICTFHFIIIFHRMNNWCFKLHWFKSNWMSFSLLFHFISLQHISFKANKYTRNIILCALIQCCNENKISFHQLSNMRVQPLWHTWNMFPSDKSIRKSMRTRALKPVQEVNVKNSLDLFPSHLYHHLLYNQSSNYSQPNCSFHQFIGEILLPETRLFKIYFVLIFLEAFRLFLQSILFLSFFVTKLVPFRAIFPLFIFFSFLCHFWTFWLKFGFFYQRFLFCFWVSFCIFRGSFCLF